MIMSSHDVDTLEEAFDFGLKIDLTFKGLLLTGTWEQCSKYEGYGHYDYQCPSKSQHVRTMFSDDVDDSKVVEDVHVPSETASTIEDISVGSDIDY